jgi:hypothetical protein
MIITESLVGFTRSGTKIFAYLTKDRPHLSKKTKHFSEADHFDAVCVFQCLVLRAFRQYGERSQEFDEMRTMEAFHMERISDESFALEKQSLGLITSVHIRNYGESRLHHPLLK